MSQTQAGIEKLQPQAGQVARQEFGATELASQAETASAALAAQARAMVEARFVMALRRPRSWDAVRVALLKACERPGFAGSATEKIWGAAWYRKPVGKGVEGFSVRFAEEAVRAMGNVDIQVATVYEDALRRIVSVTVLELESNVAYPASISIEKTVERTYLAKGQEAIKVRMNSKNEPTYLVAATEDEIFAKQNNYVSRAIRNGVIRLVPGDILGACRKRILEIREGDVAKDPDAFRRKIIDGFAKLNVPVAELTQLVGHDIATATPAELADLRDLWEALDEGKLTWADVMSDLRAESGEDATQSADAPPKRGLAGLTERLEQSAPPKAAAAAAVPVVVEPVVEPEPPKGCAHKGVTPARIATTPTGKTIVCTDCGEEFMGELKPGLRQRKLEE